MTIFLYRYIYHVTILVVLITLLTTCSSIRFIYGFMDKFIQDEIAYFLDLDEEEEVLLSQKVTEMVNWHRTSMLPSYAAYLTNISNWRNRDWFDTLCFKIPYAPPNSWRYWIYGKKNEDSATRATWTIITTRGHTIRRTSRTVDVEFWSISRQPKWCASCATWNTCPWDCWWFKGSFKQ